MRGAPPAAFHRASREEARQLGSEIEGVQRTMGALFVIDPATAPITVDRIAEQIRIGIRRAPRCAQRLAPTPLGVAPPLWVDDPDFFPARHVEAARPDRPLTRAELEQLVAREVRRPLDLTRPPWRMVLAQCDDGRAALLVVAHHCLADGGAALAGFVAMLSASPATPAGNAAPATGPAPLPSQPELLAWGLADRAAGAAASARRAAGAISQVSRPTNVRHTASHLRTVVRRNFGPRAPAGVFNLPISPAVEVALIDRSLTSLLALKRHLSRQARCADLVTINDIVLAAVAGGVRRWMLDQGRRPEDLRVKVPFTLRRRRLEGHEMGTRVSRLVIDLPVGEPDPVERVRAVNREMYVRKRNRDAETIAQLIGWIGALPDPVAQPILRRLVRNPRVHNFSITNLPRIPSMAIAGEPVAEAYGVATLNANEGLVATVTSDRRGLFVCLTADPSGVDDLPGLARAIAASFDELERLATATANGAPAGTRATAGAASEQPAPMEAVP